MGVLIVTMDSTHIKVKMQQVKLFLKVYKALAIPYVPVGKVMLYFCLSVYIVNNKKTFCCSDILTIYMQYTCISLRREYLGTDGKSVLLIGTRQRVDISRTS